MKTKYTCTAAYHLQKKRLVRFGFHHLQQFLLASFWISVIRSEIIFARVETIKSIQHSMLGLLMHCGVCVSSFRRLQLHKFMVSEPFLTEWNMVNVHFYRLFSINLLFTYNAQALVSNVTNRSIIGKSRKNNVQS